MTDAREQPLKVRDLRRHDRILVTMASEEDVGASFGIGLQAADGFFQRVGMVDQVALGAGGQQAADIGRKFTKREMPW